MRKSFDFASPPDVDLLYALKLPPEKAIAYFRDKGFAFSWNWQDLWQEAHSLAFTVAKAMRLDVLQAIREEMQKRFTEGITLEEFRKNLTPRLKALGWWGEIINKETGEVAQVGPWRLNTIYRTNTSTAMMAGRYKALMENVEDRPYFQWVAVLDSKTRPAHRALDGKVFRYDDPFWNTHWPPLDFN